MYIVSKTQTAKKKKAKKNMGIGREQNGDKARFILLSSCFGFSGLLGELLIQSILSFVVVREARVSLHSDVSGLCSSALKTFMSFIQAEGFMKFYEPCRKLRTVVNSGLNLAM